jgi:hypothetical protein
MARPPLSLPAFPIVVPFERGLAILSFSLEGITMLSPKILAALAEVDAAHAELFAVLDEEDRKRPILTRGVLTVCEDKTKQEERAVSKKRHARAR